MSTPTPDAQKAQIFLSSGQRPEERKIAEAIAAKLRSLFRVFITSEVETCKELLEVIHPALLDSDYFVFVDFLREELKGPSPARSRGSLYSHQELALAFYLGIDLAAFRETGVEFPAGMSSTILGNGKEFSAADRSKLDEIVFEVVEKKVREGLWSTKTRNQLELQFSDGPVYECQNATRNLNYYHISVENLHYRKRATNSSAYIERLVINGTPKTLKPVELKWRLIPFPNVSIWPKGSKLGNIREFDAFVVEFGSPNKIIFESLTDAPKADWTFDEQGVYEVTYVVQSDQFEDSRFTLVFNFTGGQNVTMQSGPSQMTKPASSAEEIRATLKSFIGGK
jgi:hypothetical protein